MSKKKQEEQSVKFYRIVEHPVKPGDTYNGYQGEMVEVVGDKVVARSFVDKPNLFEYAQTATVDLMDPRNNVEPI